MLASFSAGFLLTTTIGPPQFCTLYHHNSKSTGKESFFFVQSPWIIHTVWLKLWAHLWIKQCGLDKVTPWWSGRVALGVKSQPLKITRTGGGAGRTGGSVGDWIQRPVVKTSPQGVHFSLIMRCPDAVQEAAKNPGSLENCCTNTLWLLSSWF